ncbi:response regulator transcription factor [Gracilibacillus massiliensis]|uniref:response regulator transcription factor n=1 Tax=Gracilibacillus massiliensis TaxID=1564956 RepID=UPI00071CFAD6|nr:response regulator transcription factor [Gracilibacillus massiliensis]
MNTIKVMIADDQRIICDGLAVMFHQQADMKVVATATNGEEAINKAKTVKPDVILMDIRMPFIGGITATKIIKQDHPSIKIIMLTTFSQNEYILQALKNGASGYLLKDADLQQLVDAIYQSLRGQILIPESIQSMLMQQLDATSDNKPASFASSVRALKERNIQLTPTELHVLELLMEGKSNQQIAEHMYLSVGTIKNYVSKIYRKIGVSGRSEAILFIKSLV